MRILQIGPAVSLVGPDATDPVAINVFLLTEALVRRGHEVTLWAAPGSSSSARLRTLREPLKQSAGAAERARYERMYAVAATAEAATFDLVHNHAGEAV